MESNFKLEQLIKLAKRENNNKRSYLYVNPIQGKHIPVSPGVSLELFRELAAKIESTYSGEKILIIGFAETATAIASALACMASNVIYYMNTTRESIEDTEYLFFTESHSHATEQRLVKNHLSDVFQQVDRIVFAEDEVTTGNTIEKLIHVIEDHYQECELQFGIISILNSMTDQRLEDLSHKKIVCDYIHRIPFEYRIHDIESYTYHDMSRQINFYGNDFRKKIFINDYWNCRIVTAVDTIRRKLHQFIEKSIKEVIFTGNEHKILVLGTEEFMYPGMIFGKELEVRYPSVDVRFHATTRSPILTSDDPAYPLQNRHTLDSLYEKDRRTFIYNLEKYDQIFIVTDAAPINDRGLSSLFSALEQYGNDNIHLIMWSDK